MSLQGVLSDFGVADVFQLIAQQRKTGVLTIENEGRSLEVYFQEGAVLRARPAESRPDGALAEFLLRTGAISEPALSEAQRQQEETLESLSQIMLQTGALAPEELERVVRLVSGETIFELFLWDQGAFKFRPRDVSPEPGDEEVGAEMVLLDALRMLDEWTQVSLRLPDLSAVVVKVADPERFRERCGQVRDASGLGADEVERLFHLANGRISARRVIDLSRLGTFLGAKGLVEMTRSGLLRLEAASPARTETEKRSFGSPHLVLGAAALVVAALVATGLLLARPEPVHDFSIPVDLLERAREQAGGERLRLALDSYRWATGRYPDSLERLPKSGAARLASASGAGYIYHRYPGGYTLEPEPWQGHGDGVHP